MKTVHANNTDDTCTFYIDIFNDIHNTYEQAAWLGVTGRVIVDSLYVGSLDEQKKAAKHKYINSVTDEI